MYLYIMHAHPHLTASPPPLKNIRLLRQIKFWKNVLRHPKLNYFCVLVKSRHLQSTVLLQSAWVWWVSGIWRRREKLSSLHQLHGLRLLSHCTDSVLEFTVYCACVTLNDRARRPATYNRSRGCGCSSASQCSTAPLHTAASCHCKACNCIQSMCLLCDILKVREMSCRFFCELL